MTQLALVRVVRELDLQSPTAVLCESPPVLKVGQETSSSRCWLGRHAS